MSKRTVKVELTGDGRDLARTLSQSENAVAKWEKRLEQADDKFKKTFDGKTRKVKIEVDEKSAESSFKKSFQLFLKESSQAAKKVAEHLGRGLDSPYVMGALVGGIVAASPAISTVISAAVLTGLGAATLAGGIALAAQDPRVKAAGSAFVTELTRDWKDAAQPLVGPVLRSFDVLASVSKSILPEMRGNFAMLAPFVDKLTEGLGGFIRNVMPGLTEGLKASRPFLSALALWLPRLGDAISDFFRSISRNSADTATNFLMLLEVINVVIRGLGKMIGFLTDTFDILLRVTPGAGAALDNMKAALAGVTSGTSAAATATDRYAQSTNAYNRRAELMMGTWDGLIDKAGDLSAAFDEINGANLDLFDAERKSVESTFELMDALKESNGVIDNRSKESRAAGEALSAWIAQEKEHIAAVQADAEANGRGASAAAEARAQYDKSRESLIGTLVAYKMTRTAAEELATRLFNMPNFRLDSSTLQTATDRINELARQLRGLVDRTYVANIILNETRTTRQINEGNLNDRRFGNRWGGVYTHAATGALRDAHIAPGGPTRYAYAEASTRGEAFVPKSGNYGRSMAILSHAAGWYGARVVPGGSGGGGVEVMAPVILELDGEKVWESQLRFKRGASKSSLGL